MRRNSETVFIIQWTAEAYQWCPSIDSYSCVTFKSLISKWSSVWINTKTWESACLMRAHGCKSNTSVTYEHRYTHCEIALLCHCLWAWISIHIVTANHGVWRVCVYVCIYVCDWITMSWVLGRWCSWIRNFSHHSTYHTPRILASEIVMICRQVTRTKLWNSSAEFQHI